MATLTNTTNPNSYTNERSPAVAGFCFPSSTFTHYAHHIVKNVENGQVIAFTGLVESKDAQDFTRALAYLLNNLDTLIKSLELTIVACKNDMVRLEDFPKTSVRAVPFYVEQITFCEEVIKQLKQMKSS